ncbi:MAG TPA: hypothetical protein VK552_10065 [Reyranella sp.]|jgi:hypothetical protein|nr:hypothetical protein [Reyranella sp.]
MGAQFAALDPGRRLDSMAGCAIVLRLGGGDMATSKCGHCGEGLFELKTIEPVGGSYKVNMVQCSACGAVVGAVYDFNAGVMLQLQEKKIDDIAELVGRIDAGLRAVVAALNRL